MLLASTLAGCASYEAHYSKFDALNSAGEPRSFLLSWKTKRYPGWTMLGEAASPVRLESQCSSRVWILKDASMDACDVTEVPPGRTEPAAIRACGIPGKDLDRKGRPVSDPGYQCMSLTDSQGSDRILELGATVQLSVGCYPEETQHSEGDEIVNTDYLKPSAVPYTVPMGKAPLYSMEQRPPALDDAVCEK